LYSPRPPKLTVAIPTYNGVAHLSSTLDSILTQDCQPFELLVSDDGSHDGTVALVRELAGNRARIVLNEHRLGLAANWNQCVAHCRTPLIAIVHQDDILEPGHLDAHLQSFLRDDRIGLTGSASTVIDELGQPVPPDVVDPGGLGPSDRIFLPGELFEPMVDGNPLRCSAVTIRVEAHRDVAGFQSSYRYVLDWDFWFRVSRRWRVAWLATPTVKVRWHKASETHRFKSGIDDLEEIGRFLETLFLLRDPKSRRTIEQRRRANRKLCRSFLNRSHEALRGGQLDLARTCLRRGWGLSSGTLIRELAADPRLFVQMATLVTTPRLAGRLFARVGQHGSHDSGCQ
jgi:glycosyltransferase involved in cell wall biosynthesis